MEYCNDFRYDLKVGQQGENLLGSILEDSTIEVKTDLQASQTGNVFVEYQSRGKQSGISTSQAKWYAFILSGDSIRIISTSSLKDKCRRYLHTPRDVSGGDNNTSKGILLPLVEL